MKFPRELKYTATHEWAQKSAQNVRVGISDYAQNEISDIVFVELPKIGQACTKGQSSAVIESVKAAFDIYAPVSGSVRAVNKELEKNPGHVNMDCYQQGWLFEIEMSNENEWNLLMDAQNYEAYLKADKK